MAINNLIFIAAFGSFFIYMLVILFEKYGKSIGKRKVLNEVEEKYENLRRSRREMLNHYYWA